MSVDTKFITTTSEKLDSVSVVNGQVIALSDRSAWFYDMGGSRHAIVGTRYCTTKLPATTEGREDTIYILTEADSENGVYIFQSNAFVKVAGLGEKYTDFVGASDSTEGVAGLVPAPSEDDSGKFLKGDGTWANPVNTEYGEMTGASDSAKGSSGLVPAPEAGSADRFLASDGKWKQVETTDTKNTAGATQSDEKLYIVGAETQDDNPETHTNSKVFVQNGKLHSDGTEVVTTSGEQALTNKTYNGYNLGNIVSKSIASDIAEDDENIPTASQVYAAVQKALSDAKSYVDSTVSDVVQFNIKVEDQLPETGEEHTIYLIPAEDTEDKNAKLEYLYIDGEWEQIGSTKVDLSDYVTTNQMSEAIESAKQESQSDLGLSVVDGKICITFEE